MERQAVGVEMSVLRCLSLRDILLQGLFRAALGWGLTERYQPKFGCRSFTRQCDGFQDHFVGKLNLVQPRVCVIHVCVLCVIPALYFFPLLKKRQLKKRQFSRWKQVVRSTDSRLSLGGLGGRRV